MKKHKLIEVFVNKEAGVIWFWRQGDKSIHDTFFHDYEYSDKRAMSVLKGTFKDMDKTRKITISAERP